MTHLKATEFSRRRLMAALSALSAAGLAPFSVKAQSADAKPATPMPSIEVFSAPAFVDQIALSPDGKHVALVTQKGDDKLLFYMDLATQKPRWQNMGPVKLRGLLWGDNNHIVTLASRTTISANPFDKQELSYAHITNIDTDKVTPLFIDQVRGLDIKIGSVRRVKVNGEYRLFVNADEYGHIYRRVDGTENTLLLLSYSIEGGQAQKVAGSYDGSTYTSNFLYTTEGRPVAHDDFDSLHKKWSLYFNKALPGKAPVFLKVYAHATNISPLHTPSLEGLGRDGLSVVISVPSLDDSGEDYYEVSPDGKLSEPLDPDGKGKGKGKDRSPLFHPVTKCLAGFSHRDDFVTNAYFDPLMKKLNENALAAMGGDYRIFVADYAEDPRKMIIYGESPQDAGTYYFVDFSTGNNQLIAHNYPDLPAAWISQKQPIDYLAADGLPIHAYLSMPPNRPAKNLPLIVLPHGGPRARDYVDFDWQAQALAAQGYAVLQPNFRGSTGYGQNFVKAGDGEWGRKMQTDLSDGVRYLARQGIIDAQRVAIMGASYGGYAALAGATFDPDVYKCAVSIAGPSDLYAMMNYDHARNLNSSVINYWKKQIGPDGFKEASPAEQAAKAYCPILLLHGTDDTVIPIDQSQRMEKALKDAGKTVEFVTYKGQDHWETVGSSRIEMMKAALAFLNKYNPA